MASGLVELDEVPRLELRLPDGRRPDHQVGLLQPPVDLEQRGNVVLVGGWLGPSNLSDVQVKMVGRPVVSSNLMQTKLI